MDSNFLMYTTIILNVVILGLILMCVYKIGRQEERYAWYDAVWSGVKDVVNVVDDVTRGIANNPAGARLLDAGFASIR